MPQVKIFGLREHLGPIIPKISEVIHACVVVALDYPAGKRAHRFFQLDQPEFFYPDGRSPRYTILEFSMFEGRTVEAKKKLIRLLFARFQGLPARAPDDPVTTLAIELDGEPQQDMLHVRKDRPRRAVGV